MTLTDGAASGTFIAAGRSVPSYRMIIGTDGEAARIRTSNFSGRVTATLRAESTTNTILAAFQQSDEITGVVVGPLVIIDFSSQATIWASPLAFLEGPPQDNFTDGVRTRVWTLWCNPLIPFPTGGKEA